MRVSKTDIRLAIRLLEGCAELVDKYCSKPWEQDRARRARKLCKKLKKKGEEDADKQD